MSRKETYIIKKMWPQIEIGDFIIFFRHTDPNLVLTVIFPPSIRTQTTDSMNNEQHIDF